MIHVTAGGLAREIDHKFAPLSAILGPNGSGKSTLLGILAAGTIGNDDWFGEKAGGVAKRAVGGILKFSIDDGNEAIAGQLKATATKAYRLAGYSGRTITLGMEGSPEARRKFLSAFVDDGATTTADIHKSITAAISRETLDRTRLNPLGSETAIAYAGRASEALRVAKNEDDLAAENTKKRSTSIDGPQDLHDAQQLVAADEKTLAEVQARCAEAAKRAQAQAVLQSEYDQLMKSVDATNADIQRIPKYTDADLETIRTRRDTTKSIYDGWALALGRARESVSTASIAQNTARMNHEAAVREAAQERAVLAVLRAGSCPTCRRDDPDPAMINRIAEKLDALNKVEKTLHAAKLAADKMLSEANGMRDEAKKRVDAAEADANRERRAFEDYDREMRQSRAKIETLTKTLGDLNERVGNLDVPTRNEDDVASAAELKQAHENVGASKLLLERFADYQRDAAQAAKTSAEYDAVRKIRDEAMRAGLAAIVDEMKPFCAVFDGIPVLNPGSGKDEDPQIGAMMKVDGTAIRSFSPIEALSAGERAVFQAGIACAALCRSKAPVEKRILIIDADPCRGPLVVGMCGALAGKPIGHVVVAAPTEGEDVGTELAMAGWDVTRLERIQ